ncbi:MAG: MauE/DoxX family redox-associated membrane protein [Candidatus Binatia bacterium]
MDPVVAAVFRSGLALLFASAARHKLGDAAGFRAALRAYRLLPAPVAPAAAWLLLGAEATAAVALLIPGAPGPLLAGGLLAVYTGAIAINLARGRRDIDCGCAGPAARQPLTPWLLARTAVLLAAATAALLPARPRPFVWLDGLTVVAAVVALATLWAALGRLLANAPRLALLRGPT